MYATIYIYIPKIQMQLILFRFRELAKVFSLLCLVFFLSNGMQIKYTFFSVYFCLPCLNSLVVMIFSLLVEKKTRHDLHDIQLFFLLSVYVVCVIVIFPPEKLKIQL